MALSFGERLRAERARAGLTQDQLAARSGVAQACISHYESGCKIPGLRTYAKIVRILPGTSITDQDFDDAPQAIAV